MKKTNWDDSNKQRKTWQKGGCAVLRCRFWMRSVRVDPRWAFIFWMIMLFPKQSIQNKYCSSGTVDSWHCDSHRRCILFALEHVVILETLLLCKRLQGFLFLFSSYHLGCKPNQEALQWNPLHDLVHDLHKSYCGLRKSMQPLKMTQEKWATSVRTLIADLRQYVRAKVETEEVHQKRKCCRNSHDPLTIHSLSTTSAKYFLRGLQRQVEVRINHLLERQSGDFWECLCITS